MCEETTPKPLFELALKSAVPIIESARKVSQDGIDHKYLLLMVLQYQTLEMFLPAPVTWTKYPTILKRDDWWWRNSLGTGLQRLESKHLIVDGTMVPEVLQPALDNIRIGLYKLNRTGKYYLPTHFRGILDRHHPNTLYPTRSI